ncbi:hypothetical protein LINGRAHAP2_LOCUS18231, partial [Linum grandiflorum]
ESPSRCCQLSLFNLIVVVPVFSLPHRWLGRSPHVDPTSAPPRSPHVDPTSA